MSQSALQLQQQAAQAAGQVPGGRPYEAKFHFNEISTNNLNGIVPHISIDNRYVVTLLEYFYNNKLLF